MQQDTLVNRESALALLILLLVVSVLMRRFRGALAQMGRVQETRRIPLAAVAALSTGTAFYHFAEGWTWLGSIYFSIVTLATVGYGDLAPKTTGGKSSPSVTSWSESGFSPTWCEPSLRFTTRKTADQPIRFTR